MSRGPDGTQEEAPSSDAAAVLAQGNTDLGALLGRRARLGPTGSQRGSTADVLREADRITMARYAPPGVVIDGSARVLEFRGDTDPFLDHGRGKATLDLAKLLRKGLLVGVRSAIEEAHRTDAPSSSRGLRVHRHGRFLAVNVSVMPLRTHGSTERCALVLFELDAPCAETAPRATGAGQAERSRDDELVRLDHGLAQTTEYMLVILREHELALDELQSSNEALEGANAALAIAQEQSESTNEELARLNRELYDRSAELSRMNLELREALSRANALVDTALDDRTEAQRVEREREAVITLSDDARRRAEASDVLKDQLVATVSHELRGPLNAISGWTNILLGAGPSPDPVTLAKALAAIVRGVRTQGRLLSDLLDHSRFATGGLLLERTTIDLVTVTHAALESVRAAADAKGVSLELSGPRAVSIVFGDGDRLQQVMWNLLFNAVKFTPRGGSVRATVAREGQQAVAVIRDTGGGIPAEFLPHVFDRFRQAEAASNRTQPGLGLGLTLVRELVEVHGGTVYAESDGAGRGATFTVRLPIAAMLLPLEPETTLVGRPPHGATPRARALGGVRVLVVDDEEDARSAVVAVLERHGAEVATASSVSEALASIAAACPDLLVSDLGMPVEDGYELIRRLRLLPADEGGALRAIVVSGYATGGHRTRALRAGFEGYLEKPVAPDDLVAMLTRLRHHARPTCP